MKRRLSIFIIAFILLGRWCPAAEMAPALQSAFRDLRNWQMDKARQAARKFEGRSDPDTIYFRAMLAYYEGRYGEARKLVRSLPEKGCPAAVREFTGLVEAVYAVAKNFRETESEHFIFRYTPKDEILSHYALDTLEKAYAAVGADLGCFPKNKVIVEVYPDAASFCKASTLTFENVEKSGVIGICHSNRVMITSPRVIMNGYPWLDTLCHEYSHFVIIKKTANAVPVWLHEGIAKFEEKRWRAPRSFDLSPLSASVLAEGLKRDYLISFEQMHPTLARLNHYDAALAYAEARTVVHYLFQQYGPDALGKILDRSRGTRDVAKAISGVTGTPFSMFRDQWLAWVKKQKLVVVPGLKVLPPAIKTGMEPSQHDLAGEVNKKAGDLVLIGDLLVQEGHLDAATVEYEKAIDASDTLSRFISNRVAFVLISQRKLDKAEDILLRVKGYYPGFQVTYVNLGRVYANQKKYEKAAKCFEQAVRLNPFDLLARSLLAGTYEKLGRKKALARERARIALVQKALYGERLAKP
ncbi:MAG: tetratricopeptide repeat protein [Planctomycetes bacterium]|nr:tetratricopeptide repeat protein [Planctomycetota bacterium]